MKQNHFIVAFLFILVVSLTNLTSSLMAQEGSVYTGHENHAITAEYAQKLISNFRSGVTAGTILGEYFGRDAIMAMLSQPECVGMRIYYAKNESGKPVLVLVGVDPKGKDITKGIVNEIGSPCPPLCDFDGMFVK